MINLVNELQKAFDGDAWHGNNTLKLILTANPEKVFTHPVPNAHSIAELVLHLTAWTAEVMDRLDGIAAKEPTRGNWTTPIEMSAKVWDQIIEDFKASNQRLIESAHRLLPEEWQKEVNDQRAIAEREAINNAVLLNGLIQHHAYHSGQIALLLKF